MLETIEENERASEKDIAAELSRCLARGSGIHSSAIRLSSTLIVVL